VEFRPAAHSFFRDRADQGVARSFLR